MAPLDSIHPDIRDGVRAVCNQFDSAYWQKIDHDRAYPEALVDALTGTRQRRALYAALKAGVVATVSARALMQRLPNFSSLAQNGTRPQRASTHSRSLPLLRRTMGARSVGRRAGFLGKSGTAGTLNRARMAAGLADRS